MTLIRRKSLKKIITSEVMKNVLAIFISVLIVESWFITDNLKMFLGSVEKLSFNTI